MKKLLTFKQLCVALGIAESTGRKWHAAALMGEFDFVTSVTPPGKKLLFDPEALDDWINSRKKTLPPIINHISQAQKRKEEKRFDERQTSAKQKLKVRHGIDRTKTK
jgi:hypothetical protein